MTILMRVVANRRRWMCSTSPVGLKLSAVASPKGDSHSSHGQHHDQPVIHTSLHVWRCTHSCGRRAGQGGYSAAGVAGFTWPASGRVQFCGVAGAERCGRTRTVPLCLGPDVALSWSFSTSKT